MRFFGRGGHGRGNRGRGNWNRGPRRPRFSIHFDVDLQELGQLFQVGFFNWIGQGMVQSRPPFQAPQAPGILMLPHVSLQPDSDRGSRKRRMAKVFPLDSLPTLWLVEFVFTCSPAHQSNCLSCRCPLTSSVLTC
jgi:hypothetical protein